VNCHQRVTKNCSSSNKSLAFTDLFNIGFFPLLITQFISATADNALLIVCIAMLVEAASAAWWIPILKAVFIISFIVFAPFVGIWADMAPKKRVIFWANNLKALACLSLFLGLHPFVALALAGLGAALYSPAKYGLVTEIVKRELLVKANAWLEVSSVLAAILGAMAGGGLVSTDFKAWSVTSGLQAWSPIASLYAPGVLVLFGVYILATGWARLIPLSHAVYSHAPFSLANSGHLFALNFRKLWQDSEGKISLSVTTLFWGTGATLQIMILAWAQEVLGLSLSESTYLQVSAALGMVVGAIIAAKTIPMDKARSFLKLGWALGALIMVMTVVHGLVTASVLMAAMGAVCGVFIVPMNALLQFRGKEMLSAGESIAVQNFSENASVLVMVSVYSLLLALKLPTAVLIFVYGLLIVVLMSLIVRLNARLQGSI